MDYEFEELMRIYADDEGLLARYRTTVQELLTYRYTDRSTLTEEQQHNAHAWLHYTHCRWS